MNAALSWVCAAACVVLVVAEYRQERPLRIGAKLVASIAFVLIGLDAFRTGHDPARVHFGQMIALGLVLGAVGDACLLGRGKRPFLAGLVAFLLGHLAYVVAAGYLLAPTRWISSAGVAAALALGGGVAVVVWLWPRLGSLRVPVLVYVLTIVAMVIAAIAVARAGALPAPHHVLFAAGAVLFFVSDVAVARERFVVRAFANKAWGLPAYYAGQLLIAWSVVGL